MTDKINEPDDVKAFIRLLLSEGVNAHPDEDFNNYVDIHTGNSTYTADEAEKRNLLMEQAFKVSEDHGIDIYDLMQDIFLTGTGMDNFIPRPSALTQDRI